MIVCKLSGNSLRVVSLCENSHSVLSIGLDPSGYKQTARYEEEDEALLNGTEISDEEKFRDCERFKFVCPSSVCGREIVIDAVFTGAVSRVIVLTEVMLSIKLLH